MILLDDETVKSSAPELPVPPPVHPVRQYGSASLALPPSYSAAPSGETATVPYVFLPQRLPPNSMILAPADNPTQPVFCISVNLNCFTPSSYITAITRGSFEGELVGQFEMSAVGSGKIGKCMLFENEHLLSELLDHKHRVHKEAWKWKVCRPGHGSAILYWDNSGNSGTLSCFSSKERITSNLLAKFSAPTHLRKSSRPVEQVRLDIFPSGQELFEDILFSCLIIERIRTMPSL